MQPYNLTENWRIHQDERSYTLERRLVPKPDPDKPDKKLDPYWKVTGYHGTVSDALTAFLGHYTREVDLPLPQALVEAKKLVMEVVGAINQVWWNEMAPKPDDIP